MGEGGGREGREEERRVGVVAMEGREREREREERGREGEMDRTRNGRSSRQ